MEAVAHMEAQWLAHKPVNEMSTGEVRRLLIARALVHNPRALVLDEPTTGLDLLASHRFLETLRTIARHGKTIILVTHHIEEILPEIQRVILLKDVVLTTYHISALFAAPIDIQAGAAGYYKAVAGERLHELTEETASLGATGHQRSVAKN